MHSPHSYIETENKNLNIESTLHAILLTATVICLIRDHLEGWFYKIYTNYYLEFVQK